MGVGFYTYKNQVYSQGVGFFRKNHVLLRISNPLVNKFNDIIREAGLEKVNVDMAQDIKKFEKHCRSLNHSSCTQFEKEMKSKHTK